MNPPSSGSEPSHAPSIVERVIAVIVAVIALDQGYQGLTELRVNPRLLTVEYAIVFITGVVAAYAIWRGRGWSAPALALNGLTTVVLVVSLEPILKLPPEARGGLWMGAAVIALFTVAGVWYLRRRAARRRPVTT